MSLLVLTACASSGRSEEFQFQVEKEPLPYQYNPAPVYPAELDSLQISGKVVVQFTVTQQGRIDFNTFRVLESTHELFTHAVRAALQRWRFYPAEVGDRRVAAIATLPFTFVPPSVEALRGQAVLPVGTVVNLVTEAETCTGGAIRPWRTLAVTTRDTLSTPTIAIPAGTPGSVEVTRVARDQNEPEKIRLSFGTSRLHFQNTHLYLVGPVSAVETIPRGDPTAADPQFCIPEGGLITVHLTEPLQVWPP